MTDIFSLFMKRKKNYLFLFVLAIFSFNSIAQDYSKHNWYFGSSQYGILFNKSDDQPNQTDTQATPYGNAASAVATDRVPDTKSVIELKKRSG